MFTQELLEKRAGIYDQMHKILDHAESQDRDLNGEEQAQYDAMNSDIESIGNRIKRIENQSKLQSEMEQVTSSSVKPVINQEQPESKLGKAYAKRFYDAMRMNPAGAESTPVYNALEKGTDIEGGFIVPEEFETRLITVLQDFNEIRQYCNVITTGSDRNIPVENSLGTASWLEEEEQYTESDAVFGRVIIKDHKLGTIIKVSEELLQDSMFDLPSYLTTNFGKRFGLAEESAFVNGDGSGKPTGIVGGSSAGVTAAAQAAITTDELIDLQHSLSRPYRANAIWLMNDSTAKLVRKLKDGDGQYLWQPGLQAGQPDVLFGRPVICSTAMPAATTGNKSVVFGDMSNYTIADRLGTTLQRLNELYAANGQVGFKAYKRTDGKVTLAEGIKHLVQA